MKKLTKSTVLGIVLIAIFAPIIIVNLVIVFKGIIKPTEVPTVFGIAPLVVDSDSMAINRGERNGAFNKGDLIFSKKVNPDTLEKGDIITYYDKNGDIVTHRIFNKYNDDNTRITYNMEPAFETKGDHANGVDVIPESNVIGKYIGRMPLMGSVSKFLKSPIGAILVIGIPIGLVLLYDYLSKQKDNNGALAKIAELEAQLAAKEESEQTNTKE